MKPSIGITCSYAPDRVGRPEFPDYAVDYLKSQYSRYVFNSGGLPFILPNLDELAKDKAILKRYISKLDGILFSGGADFEPSFFGENERHKATVVHIERDNFEIPLISYVLKKTNLPIFGICRGFQLLNIALGGTLYQDITQFWEDTKPQAKLEHRRMPDKSGIRHSSWHRAKIEPGTKLAEIVSSESLIVSSSHHQFVKKIGNGLIVSAVAPDGAIEGLELQSKRFVVAVQWHPEVMNDESSERLFEAFVKVSATFNNKCAN